MEALYLPISKWIHGLKETNGQAVVLARVAYIADRPSGNSDELLSLVYDQHEDMARNGIRL